MNRPVAAESRQPETAGEFQPIPSQWNWHYKTLLELRRHILQAHTEHRSQAEAPADNHDGDSTDAAELEQERNLLWTELSSDDDKLQEIESALARIRAGTYGHCQQTGETIPPSRLRAIPWTRYCRSAAEQIERSRASTARHTRRLHISAFDEDEADE